MKTAALAVVGVVALILSARDANGASTVNARPSQQTPAQVAQSS